MDRPRQAVIAKLNLAIRSHAKQDQQQGKPEAPSGSIGSTCKLSPLSRLSRPAWPAAPRRADGLGHGAGAQIVEPGGGRADQDDLALEAGRVHQQLRFLAGPASRRWPSWRSHVEEAGGCPLRRPWAGGRGYAAAPFLPTAEGPVSEGQRPAQSGVQGNFRARARSKAAARAREGIKLSLVAVFAAP